MSKIALARTNAVIKQEHIDLSSLYARASENKIRILDGWVKRNIAETLLYFEQEHLFEAEKWIKQSIEVDNKRGMMFNLGQDYAPTLKY